MDNDILRKANELSCNIYSIGEEIKKEKEIFINSEFLNVMNIFFYDVDIDTQISIDLSFLDDFDKEMIIDLIFEKQKQRKAQLEKEFAEL